MTGGFFVAIYKVSLTFKNYRQSCCQLKNVFVGLAESCAYQGRQIFHGYNSSRRMLDAEIDEAVAQYFPG